MKYSFGYELRKHYERKQSERRNELFGRALFVVFFLYVAVEAVRRIMGY